MVTAVHGTLITCDESVKRYIQSVNDQFPPENKFVVADLDDTHLLVQPERVDFVFKKVREWMDDNHFVAPRVDAL